MIKISNNSFKKKKTKKKKERESRKLLTDSKVIAALAQTRLEVRWLVFAWLVGHSHDDDDEKTSPCGMKRIPNHLNLLPHRFP